jgi:hypothetical protein
MLLLDVRICHSFGYAAAHLQVQRIIVDDLKKHARVTEEQHRDSNGNVHIKKRIDWNYRLPTLDAGNQVVLSRVCGNAFARGYGIGKNTRTSYQKVAEAELLNLAAPPSDRQLRYIGTFMVIRTFQH